MGIYIVIWFVVRDNNIASLFVLRISERTTNRAFENCEIHRLGMESQLQTKNEKRHLKSARNFVFGRRWYTEGRMQGEVSAT
jgi:hypothetical protein